MDAPRAAPHKRRRTGERERVTRACDRCKRHVLFARKIKCTGLQPCEFCCRADADCTFDTAYSRGRAPVILSANAESAQINNGVPKSYNFTGTIDHRRSPSGLQERHSLCAPSPLMPTSSPKSHVSPQTGLHGRYIGPASGVSFLQRVQMRLGQASSFSHPDDIFTFGDAPFHQHDSDLFSCMMLPRDVAQQLIDRYFDFAMPTYRFLHRPAIQDWFSELYDTFGAMHDADRAPAKIALILMVIAHGRVYMSDADRPGPMDLSHRLYLAAEQQLAKESGPIRLTSIQARLTQCYYLLTQSHINRCWRAFGTVSHLALATGLNRKRRTGGRSGLSNVESESRRRTFWCAYALDVHLSVVLGRPQLFHDDDIDIELPACIDDQYLSENSTGPVPASTGLSLMLGPIAHINIARIIKRILRELYPLQPISASTRTKLTHSLSATLADWRSNLSSFLDTESFDASMFVPIVQRQRNVLNLTYWHAVVLLHRPFLLNNFTGSRHGQASAEDGLRTEPKHMEESVQKCVSSAMKTVNAINHMTQSRQMSRAFWIAAYCAFNASIVLYIYVIQKRTSSPEEYNEYFSAATQCQSHIASIADKGSLPERYLLLLEELRLEAVRQTSRNRNVGPESGTTSSSAGIKDPVPLPDAYPYQSKPEDMPATEPTADFSAGFRDQLSDYSDWDMFASMVSSGLGNLDAFLIDDALGQMNDFAATQPEAPEGL